MRNSINICIDIQIVCTGQPFIKPELVHHDSHFSFIFTGQCFCLFPKDSDGASVRGKLPSQYFDEGRFAGTGWSKKAENLAFGDRKADITKDSFPVKGLL